MAKKYPPGYVKNPRFVAMGKVRAAQGIRNKQGRYVSRVFVNEIAKTVLATKGYDVSKIPSANFKKADKAIQEAGLTHKQIKKFYDTHPIAFEQLMERGTIRETSKNSNQIESVIDEYDGKIKIDNGKDKLYNVSKAEAKFLLAQFRQYMTAHANIVEFSIHPVISIDGKMILCIPDVKAMYEALKNHFNVNSLEELLEIEGKEMTEAIEDYVRELYNTPESNITMYASDKDARIRGNRKRGARRSAKTKTNKTNEGNVKPRRH